MTSGRRVLVVDGLDETAQVLKAVLEPQGLAVDRVRHHAPPQEAVETPNVIVVHRDDPEEPPQSDEWHGIPTVVIGTAELGHDEAEGNQHLAKPFEYGDLIRAIERLLAKSA